MKTKKEKTDVDDYIDEHFPKGKDKRRGEVLVVNALAQIKGKAEAISSFAEKIKEDSIRCGCRMCQDEIERIDKLAKEQSTGETK